MANTVNEEQAAGQTIFFPLLNTSLVFALYIWGVSFKTVLIVAGVNFIGLLIDRYF